jgi:putative membrane protein
MTGVLLAYLHFVAVAALFALLTAEMLLFRPDLALPEQRRLVFVDIAYGAVAAVVLLTGIARLFATGKGLGFYFGNIVFHGMGAAFLAAALLSLYPTRRFIVRWRGLRAGAVAAFDGLVASRIRRIFAAELALLLLALLAAVLMARGIGLDWLG